ncbi:unnamed protein product [Paramecium octaurelia]|uniref:Transmembrane protein n=1 Tax=Paramecium octaurelia TaxID=43137 RepID=A0A8S1UAW5_PAROT|nr:unnamed protein product [Paramecium octaurelia]
MSHITITTLILFKLLQVVHLKLSQSTYYFFENEYIPTHFPVISIPLDFDISNQSQIQSLVQEQNLTEEYKYSITPKAKLFSLIKSEKQDIEIVQLEDQKLTFLYQIKNYLSNNQLLINLSNYSIPLTGQNCFSLFYLKEESYLLICKIPENKIAIQILNLNQQSSPLNFTTKALNVQDYNPLCEFETNFEYSLLVIFEKNCPHQKLETFFIDENNQEIINQTNFILEEYNKSNQLITKINICSSTILQIQTNNESLILDLKSLDLLNILLFDQKYYSNVFQCIELPIVQVRDNQLRFNKFSFNVSTEGFIQGFLLNQIFILQKNDHVIVYYSDNLQIVIRNSFQQFFSLSNLPYTLGVTEKGDLLIYRIKIPRLSFTYQNSSKSLILEYQRQSKNYIELLDQQILDLQILSESQPKFLIKNNTEFIGISEASRLQFLLNQIQMSLPLQIKQLYINEKLINFYEETRQLGCNIDIGNLNQIFIIISLGDDSFLILYIQNDATQIVITRCAKGTLQIIKKIKFAKGFINIINFNQNQFCVVQENSLRIYKFQNQQLLGKYYTFNHTIIAASNLNNANILGLVFKDCNQISYFIDNDDLQIHEIKSQYLECNGNKQQKSELFFITEHQIFFKNQELYQEQLILKETIIKAEVMLHFRKILLFTQYQQKLKIQHFSFFSYELQFLYDCPLYNYTLKIPLNYKLQGPLLSVLAENSQQQSVLLVYNTNNEAINSLIQVIELDQDHIHFDFIFGSQNLLYYYYQNAFQIRELGTYTIIFQNSIKQISAFKELNYNFTFGTPILNEIINYNFTVKHINNDYNIMLIQNDTLRLNSNNILDMSNIFSNIISIEVVSQNYQLIRPLTFTNEKMTCELYQNNCCFNQNQLKCFKNNQIFVYKSPDLRCYVIAIYFNDSHSECTIICYANLRYQMIMISFQNYYQSIKPQMYEQKILEDPEFQHYINVDDLEIIFADRDLVIVKPGKTNQIFVILKLQQGQQLGFNYSNRENTLLSVSRIKDDYYVFLQQSQDNILYSIVTINVNRTNERQQIFYKKQIQDQMCISNSQFIDASEEIKQLLPIYFHKIKTIETTLVDDVLVIELLMLFEIQFGFVIRIRMDTIKYGICQIDVLQTLRYPHNSQLSQIFYVNKDYIIISIIRFNIRSLILYDRFQDKNLSLIHSIDAFPENNYKKIEQFNNSHLALVILSNIFYEVQIIALSQYKLECINKCNLAATLILKNEVSNLTITVQNNNTENPLQYNIRLITIIFDLISISLFLQFGKKKQKMV